MTSRVSEPDGGYTLVEVMVTTAILLIVLAILAPLLTGSLTTFGRQTDRTGALDQADIVLQQLEHDVLASSTLNVVAPGNDLQLITGQVGNASCIEYKVPPQASPQPLALQRRVRTVGSTWPGGGGWQTLLTTITLSGHSAGSVIPNPAGANPFASAGNSYRPTPLGAASPSTSRSRTGRRPSPSSRPRRRAAPSPPGSQGRRRGRRTAHDQHRNTPLASPNPT